MPEFYITFGRKIFFGIFLFFLGGGQPLVQGWAPGPPPAKSGPGVNVAGAVELIGIR